MKPIYLLTLILFISAALPHDNHSEYRKLDIQKVDQNQMIKDIMVSASEGSAMNMNLWLPYEYFEVAVAKTNPSMSDKKLKEALEPFEDVTMVLIVKAEV